ncbi:MAG: hypothetical protein IKX33_01035 [Prevotella sp.]|nr:hypothetical protein [Prevotella sp.]
MKRILLLITSMLMFVITMGQDFTTQGDGKTYSLAILSQTTGSGVTNDENVFTIRGTVTIAVADSFKMDEGVTVIFTNNASLVLQGTADLHCKSARTRLTIANDNSMSDGISIQNETIVTEVSNIDFEYVGLRNYSPMGLNVTNCTFNKHVGGVSSALFLGTDGAKFHISGCQFCDCQKAAIGGAANFFCNVLIEDCTFSHNSLANGNIPQINLSAAPDITIRNCIVDGDSTLNMVGGIAIANWYGSSGNHATIENCTITNNRYGITTMGVMDVIIKNNNIVNNKFESNPNNGGSGISLYDPYMMQTAMITGNRIERSLWGITIIGCGEVNIGKTQVELSAEDYNPGKNVFLDNGNNGILYDLYNNSANTVYAQGNIWNVAMQDSVSIENVIFHKNDLASLGEVIFMPAGETEKVATPMVSHKKSQSFIYDLHGLKHEQSATLPKGIYIINGKKTIIK